ncbi:MAG: hypothetical protein ACMUIE_00080 [Thermoplasmatota archaeon]
MSKLKTAGLIIGIIAIVGIFLVIILSFVLPPGFWMFPKNAEKEYDDWVESSSRGDKETFHGKIAEEDETSLLGVSIYSYKFEGCDNNFLSSQDLGNEGDRIVVEIEYRELGPEASADYSSAAVWGPSCCCGSFMGILLILGIVLFLVGLLKKKKKPAPVPPQPEPGPAQQTYQQLYGQQPGHAPQQSYQQTYGQQPGYSPQHPRQPPY